MAPKLYDSNNSQISEVSESAKNARQDSAQSVLVEFQPLQ